MAIHLNPETEKLVQKELESGHFRSVDEIILHGIRTRHENEQPERGAEQRRQAVERALDFARNRAVSLNGISIKELLHDGHRV